MIRHRTLLSLATGLSGAAALMHETLWTRSLAEVLGSTVQAAAAVFAAFLVGLALGARLSGRIIDRLRCPSRTYALLEVGIGLAAVGVGLLLYREREFLPSVLGQSSGTAGMLHSFAFALAFAIVPTFLMGATFPAVLAACRGLGADAIGLTRLYAQNTFGAALGTLACGWYTIPSFGVTSSILLAGGMNLGAALLCVPRILVERSCPTPAAPAEPAAAPPLGGDIGRPAWLYLIALLSGCAILALEVVWSRVASFTLGNRTFAFSTLLAWVLVLLSLGAWVSGRLVRRFTGRIPLLMCGLLLASALGIVLSTALVNLWIVDPGNVVQVFKLSPGVPVLLRTLGMGLVMSLFLVPLGCLFPTGLACLPHIETKTGLQSGRYYLWNTVGSVTGSLIAGFLIIPTIGSFATAAVVAAICGLAALSLFVLGAAQTSTRRVWLGGALASTAVMVAIPVVMPAQLAWVHPGDRPILRVEDEWGVFQLSTLPDGKIRATCNRTELVFLLGSFSTSYVQEMQGHIGTFLRPLARSALVLGSGYGLTAGALAVNPRLEQIDAVEILPAMVAAADRFEPYNRSYHHNPRVHVFTDDGRHFLARARGKYDIISINVSDPHLPGSSALFNADFYRIVKRHLNPGGVVIQHAFGIDAKVVLSTLSRSFAHLRAFPAYKNGFNVVSSDAPLGAQREEMERLAAIPAMHAALASLGVEAPIDAWRVFSKGLDRSDLTAFIDPALVSTDDHPLLEFSRTGDPAGWFFSNE
jgi:spermidine synthase